MGSPKTPTFEVTTRHILYLVLMQGLGSMILDGLINFGIATAMYKTSNKPVHLWSFPNTLAGDATVTVIVQQALTWILGRLSVQGDVGRGLIAALRMPKNANFIIRWFVGLNPDNILQQKTGKETLFFHVKRILVYMFVSWCFFWPLGIAALSGLRNNNRGVDTRGVGGDFNNWPLPEVFKLIYGACMGMTTPFVSYISLIYQGEIAHAKSQSEEEETFNE
ncbi:hypothetical protein BGZ76_000177 [Entomortierella beljakovae]|nr:hypothetical protein BGZ76_000177 [Entomortierella beljakovae]